MRQLSSAGAQAVADLAQRHGFSSDAVATMLDAVVSGGGGMAQFSHPEFGGSGQWMRGGMTMIGDMFNNALKGRVDALCADLAALVGARPDLVRSGSFQSQSQGGYTQPQGSASLASASLFVPPPQGSAAGNWWGDDLARPNSTGSQNNSRYAWFAQARRLAVDVNGTVTIYDTLDHAIGGVSQQQSHGGTMTFTSQHGVVDVASLPVVSVNGVPASTPSAASHGSSIVATDVFDAIEKLADLHRRGILSDNEFSSKKAELLSRL
jgi:Short C-terminal domain